VIERIGTGGMATVYRAEMKTNDGVRKLSALKILHPHLAQEHSFVQMFLKECELAAQLRHENIVSPFDFGEIGGVYYMAMDYHRALNLRRVLERLNREGLTLTTATGLLILTEVLQGLRHAHRFACEGQEIKEIIHRDVSPQNVLLTTDGDVRLIDFGIAKIMGETGLTDIGTIKGKVQYMSPEQAAGRPLDPRTDLYSLGVVAHEVFTGEMLFPERDPTRVLRQIQLGDMRYSDEFDLLAPRLQRTIRRALNRNASRRHSDARSFREELLEVARRDLPEYDPKAVSKELGMLVASIIETPADAPEEVRLPTYFLEPCDEPPPAPGTDTPAPHHEPEPPPAPWSRIFAYACGLLIVLALLLEVMGVNLRPENERPQADEQPSSQAVLVSPDEPSLE